MRYFVAVAEELSFRRAARGLHVSHPALSQQIQDLENELGLKLFERNSRRVELTEAGRAFLLGVRRVLAAAKEAIAQAQEAAKGERGRLVIGSLGPLTSSFLPAALARFREQRPLVGATALDMNNRAEVEAVLDGSTDDLRVHRGSARGDKVCLRRSLFGISSQWNSVSRDQRAHRFINRPTWERVCDQSTEWTFNYCPPCVFCLILQA